MERKDFLKNSIGLLGFSAVIIEACKKNVSGTDTGSNSTGSCTVTPEETTGPYPTHTPSSYVRNDITNGQTGVPLTINITINNTNNNCAALANAIVDIWHCNSDGYYSEYIDGPGGSNSSEDLTGEHFLRGRQTTDANGLASFTSIYPGWYSGRAPHIHVHVYNSAGTSLKVTQIAFPTDICNTVYTKSSYYSAHGTQDTSNSTDTVFSDSLDEELATVTGNVTDGYILTHTINVAG